MSAVHRHQLYRFGLNKTERQTAAYSVAPRRSRAPRRPYRRLTAGPVCGRLEAKGIDGCSHSNFDTLGRKRGAEMKHPIDTAVIFGALWLLASMLIDVLTPKELSVYVIGAALAPLTIVGALFYHLRFPPRDLAITVAALWLVAVMVLEWVTPKPLSPYFMTAAVAPSVLVGGWIHGAMTWRRIARASRRKKV